MIGRLYVCSVSHRCVVFQIRVLHALLTGIVVGQVWQQQVNEGQMRRAGPGAATGRTAPAMHDCVWVPCGPFVSCFTPFPPC